MFSIFGYVFYWKSSIYNRCVTGLWRKNNFGEINYIYVAGPSLLFSRGSDNKKFYSCAAHRNRKKCSFFLWENQAEVVGQQFMAQFERDPIVTKMTRFKLQSR